MAFPRRRIIGYSLDKVPLVLNEVGEREEIGYVFLRDCQRAVDELSDVDKWNYLRRLALKSRLDLPPGTTRSLKHAERMKRDENPSNKATVIFLTALGLHPDEEVAIDRYVVDILVGGIVIELDGHFHELVDAQERDRLRDNYLQSLGLRVIRIPVHDLYRDPLKAIDEAIARCL